MEDITLEKIDMQIVSVTPCDITDVKKSFASISETEGLDLDPDLMYARFIMCHEGSNANGDTFTNDVLSRAQYTPRFKPIDWEHGQPMIGHIIDSRYGEDEQGRGYIEAIGVIWKFIYPEIAAQIKEKSKTGELRLSMECYFKNANYKYGEQLFDEEQATQLGIVDYVGREYMGQKVYRVFTEVLFGGVGVVANPADKEAVFLAVAKKKAEDTIVEIENQEAVAEIIRPVNDFKDRVVTQDTVNAVTIAKFVKAFDKAKSSIVSRFNKETLATKEQLVTEVRDIINSLLADVSNINNDYFVGVASADASELAEDNFNLKLCEHIAEQERRINEMPIENQNEEVVVQPEAVVAEEVTIEDVANTELVADDVDSTDYKSLASQLQAELDDIKGKLSQKDTALANLNAELDNIKEGIAKKEKAETLATRLAELEGLGIELSEARKEKEVTKISAMDQDAFNDYKEFLSELITVKVEASTEEVQEQAEEVVEELEVEITDSASASLNVETEQPKTIKPFGHLVD